MFQQILLKNEYVHHIKKKKKYIYIYISLQDFTYPVLEIITMMLMKLVYDIELMGSKSHILG